MENKDLLILQRIDEALSIKEESGDIILEGIFAKFGILNNNGRIYEEAEYLPHLEYLQEKISKRRLMGELDHPEKFEVSLNKVSHIIESITYNKEKREIRGKVRLLDTPTGNIAKTLVKAGVPISISSRAAGTVNESKKVQIRRIFTYDLVYEPGFNEAVLQQINESFSFQDFDLTRKQNDNLISVNEQYGFDGSDGISLFEVKEESILESTITPLPIPTMTIEPTNNDRPVLVKEMQKYSLKVQEEFKLINEKLSINGDSPEARIVKLENALLKVVSHINEMSIMLDNSIQFTESVSEQAAHAIDFAEQVATIVNENADSVELLKEHTNSLTLTINENLVVLEESVSSIENTASLILDVKSIVDENSSYVDVLKEQIEESITNSETKIEYLKEYFEVNLQDAILAESEIKTEIYNTREFSERISERSNELVDFVDFKLNGQPIVAPVNSITESTKQIINYASLTSTVDDILHSIKNTKIEENRSNSKYNFLETLNEAKREEFLLLDETKKQKVTTAILENSSKTQEAILECWAHALNENVEQWLAKAPGDYRKLFEGLDNSKKIEIAKQAKIYNLNNDEAIKNFWETRPQLLESNQPDVINESIIIEDTSVLGYSTNRISSVFQQMKKFTK